MHVTNSHISNLFHLDVQFSTLHPRLYCILFLHSSKCCSTSLSFAVSFGCCASPACLSPSWCLSVSSASCPVIFFSVFPVLLFSFSLIFRLRVTEINLYSVLILFFFTSQSICQILTSFRDLLFLRTLPVLSCRLYKSFPF